MERNDPDQRFHRTGRCGHRLAGLSRRRKPGPLTRVAKQSRPPEVVHLDVVFADIYIVRHRLPARSASRGIQHGVRRRRDADGVRRRALLGRVLDTKDGE